MPTYKLNNLLIKIPFNPYPSQLSVITKLTHTLLNNQTCLIESPTGTGKSISIIASIMPFLELEDKKVYLCTRTHKQIRQMVMQIKQFFAKAEPVDKTLLLSNQNSTENKPLLENSKPEIDSDKNLSSHKNLTNRNTVPPKMSILGSRNILCINEKINSQQDINSLCTDLVKNNKCKYFHNHPKAVKHFQNKLFDLEDLISYSKRTVSCPYFATKALSEKASLILSPYNYLVDPFIRKRLGINKAHIVIDEAHNIEDNLRESGSLQISVKEMIQYTNQIYSLKDKEIFKLTELFTKLKQMYYKICLPEEGDVKRINENFNNQNENFNSQTENFNNLKNTNSQSSDTSTLFRYKDLINLVKEFFSLIEINNYKNIIYNLNDEIELECLRSVEVLLYILTNIITNNKYALNVERNLFNFILLDISELFNNLIKDNLSLTLLSGTIGDIKVFENDLKHNFSNKVISDHVVSKENLFVRKVLSYKNINLVGTLSVMNDLYFKNVSFMIEEYYSFTQGGVLVFFQSYSLLQKIKKFFKVNLFVEPTNSSDLDNVINKFKNEAQKNKALLLGVYRGKISEGIDFKDNYCRLVIAVSIPYPNLTDIVVKIKKENKLWYENQALKAVNQAVGRVIRHKDDYGGIILLDSRYKFKRLSQWIERSSKDCGFEESVKDYKEFVKNRTKK